MEHQILHRMTPPLGTRNVYLDHPHVAGKFRMKVNQ